MWLLHAVLAVAVAILDVTRYGHALGRNIAPQLVNMQKWRIPISIRNLGGEREDGCGGELGRDGHC
eukprot:COSAG02_NODE_699_length_18369_cov_9.690203_11_plen_66_part_00